MKRGGNSFVQKYCFCIIPCMHACHHGYLYAAVFFVKGRRKGKGAKKLGGGGEEQKKRKTRVYWAHAHTHTYDRHSKRIKADQSSTVQ